MRSAVRRLIDAAERLPDEPCSSTRSPKPLADLVAACDELIDLCLPVVERELCGRSARWRRAEDEEESEPAAPPPAAAAATHRDWLDAKEKLRACCSTHGRKLSLRYSTYAFAEGGRKAERRDYRPGELLFLAGAHVELCAFATLPGREQVARLRASDLEHVRRCEMPCHDAPVLHYSVSQLADALFHMAKQMATATFHPHLVDYLWLLEIRAAQIVVFTFGGDVHDVVEYRKAVGGEGDDEHGPSDRFLTDAAALLRALHERLVGACEFERLAPEEAEERDGVDLSGAVALAADLRSWFVERAKRASSGAASEWFERELARLSLRPAEREFYERDFAEEATDLIVLRKYRGNAAYEAIMRRCERPIREVILAEAERDASRLPGGESLDLQLALHEMCSLYFRSVAPTLEWCEFALWESEAGTLPRQALMRDPRPKLVRSFGHFQLFYRGKLYAYDSYVAAMAAWIVLMLRYHAGRLSATLRLEALLDDMWPGRDLARRLGRAPSPEAATAPRPSGAGAAAPAPKRRRKAVVEF